MVIIRNQGEKKMKSSLQIKKELKEKGFNLKGVKIKVESLHEFIWVYVPSVSDYKEIEKAISEIAEIPVYNIMMKEI